MSKKVKYVSDNTLRYFLQKVKALISGKADKTPATNYANGLMSKEDYSKLHNLKKSDITDFPSTMPPSPHTHKEYLNKTKDTVTGGDFDMNENTVYLSGNTYTIDGANRFEFTPHKGYSSALVFRPISGSSGLQVSFSENAFVNLDISKTASDGSTSVSFNVDDVTINGNSMVVSQETIDLYKSLGMK